MRDKLSYANVMSTIAVFGVIAGGGAYAADKIGTSDLKRNAVTSAKIDNGDVRTKDIKSRAVSANKIAGDSIASAKIAVQSIAREDIRLGAISCTQLDPAVAASIASC